MPAKDFQLDQALGASTSISIQRFTIYLASQDKFDQPVPGFQAWVDEAKQLLASINGGDLGGTKI